jgi:hypothetical protein
MSTERNIPPQLDHRAKADGILLGINGRADDQSIGDYVVSKLHGIQDDADRSKTITALHRLAARLAIHTPTQQSVVEQVLGVTMAITDYGVDPEKDALLPKYVQELSKRHADFVAKDEREQKIHKLHGAMYDINQMYGKWLSLPVVASETDADHLSRVEENSCVCRRRNIATNA